MHNKKGLTLIELLVTLAIVAILITAALPNFSYYISNIKARTYGHSLHQLLQFGREAAVTHGAHATICQVTNANNNKCLLNKNWSHSVMAFIDTNQDKIFQAPETGGTDILLRRFPNPPNNGALKATQRFLSFSAPGTGLSGSLTFCPFDPLVTATRIIVMNSGRVRYALPTEIKC